jgi:hypothetical protein
MKRTMMALLVGAIVSLASTSASAQFDATHRANALENPRIETLRANGWTDEQIAQMMSGYDALMIGASVVKVVNIPLLNRVFELSPAIRIVMMWPVWKQDCSLLPTQPGDLISYLRDLGPFHTKITFIELDGGENATNSCAAADVEAAMNRYRTLLDANSYGYIVLIANGAEHGGAVASCNYNAATGSSGGWYFDSTATFLRGRVQEGWSRYFAANQKTKLENTIADMCAWTKTPTGIHLSISYSKCDTPWWNERGDPATWSCARLSYALAAVGNGKIANIQSPADTDLNGVTNYGHHWWLDEMAVDKTTNFPPRYGTDTVSMKAADFTGRRANRGWLGASSGPAVRTGDLIVKEFACGYIVANVGKTPLVFTPAVTTQMFVGRQDRARNDGSSWASYEIPAVDALWLWKNNAACFNQALVRVKHAGVRRRK